jgi:hypothetical protein
LRRANTADRFSATSSPTASLAPERPADCFSPPLSYPRGDVDNCHSQKPRVHRLPQPFCTERRAAGTSQISLKLSTFAVDILVDQCAIAASTMLVRRTSRIRAVNAECSRLNSLQDLRWGLPLAADRIDTRPSANGPLDKGIPRTDAPASTFRRLNFPQDRVLRLAPAILTA